MRIDGELKENNYSCTAAQLLSARNPFKYNVLNFSRRSNQFTISDQIYYVILNPCSCWQFIFQCIDPEMYPNRFFFFVFLVLLLFESLQKH